MKKAVIILSILIILILSYITLSNFKDIDKSSNNVISYKITPDPTSPIIIILNDWTSQHLLAKIYGELLESVGYKVEYEFYNTNEQWGALNLGIAHIQVEVWEATMAEMFYRMISSGGIIDAGNHDSVTREEWWYPDYVEEIVPGLPDWTALKNNAGLFSVPETAPKGLYLGGPWENSDAARIRALELDFELIKVQHSDDLWVELEKAYTAKRPIVLHNWTPNWVEAVYKGKFIEFPPYERIIETNPAAGINPDFAYDCGSPTNNWLKKTCWSGVKKNYTLAYYILEEFNFTNIMISELTKSVDYDKKNQDETVETWIKENQNLWKSWIIRAKERTFIWMQ